MMKNMQMQDEGTPQPTVAITPLNKEQTINGMQTTGYKATEEENTVVAWVTNDQPELNKALLTVSERMEKLTPANMRKESVRRQLQQKGLPVMVQNLGGGRYRVEEIVSVEQKPVDATLFNVPKDFTRTTGRDAMKNMPGPGAGPAKAPAGGAAGAGRGGGRRGGGGAGGAGPPPPRAGRRNGWFDGRRRRRCGPREPRRRQRRRRSGRRRLHQQGVGRQQDQAGEEEHDAQVRGSGEPQ
jgi:hypothetical protein